MWRPVPHGQKQSPTFYDRARQVLRQFALRFNYRQPRGTARDSNPAHQAVRPAALVAGDRNTDNERVSARTATTKAERSGSTVAGQRRVRHLRQRVTL